MQLIFSDFGVDLNSKSHSPTEKTNIKILTDEHDSNSKSPKILESPSNNER